MLIYMYIYIFYLFISEDKILQFCQNITEKSTLTEQLLIDGK